LGAAPTKDHRTDSEPTEVLHHKTTVHQRTGPVTQADPCARKTITPRGIEFSRTIASTIASTIARH
jgi:hypothetical protein